MVGGWLSQAPRAWRGLWETVGRTSLRFHRDYPEVRFSQVLADVRPA
jgi:hypothetical protein